MECMGGVSVAQIMWRKPIQTTTQCSRSDGPLNIGLRDIAIARFLPLRGSRHRVCEGNSQAHRSERAAEGYFFDNKPGNGTGIPLAWSRSARFFARASCCCKGSASTPGRLLPGSCFPWPDTRKAGLFKVDILKSAGSRVR
jgi:hypothetical protein